jgi:hypothetical protein
LLEPQRTNLFNFSEQLDNAYWSKIGSLTITANTNVSPDGYTNADLVTTTAAPARIQRAFTGLTAGTRTLSCFVKAGTASSFRINTFDGIVDKDANFNIATGVITSTSAGVTATITNYGNGWYRVTHNYTSAGTTYSCQFFFDNVGTYQVWGFQFEDLAAYPTSYIPSLGASVTRLADAASKTGISSLIGQTEGTIYWEIQKDAITGNCRFQLSDGTSDNWIFVSVEEASRAIRIYAGVLSGTTVDVTSVATLNDNAHKIAFAYAQNDFKVYVDGVDFLTNTSGDIPACSRLDLGSNSPTGAVLATSNISAAALYPVRLSNSELASLTSL